MSWVIGQRREVVYGVGDEPLASPQLPPPRAEAAVALGRPEKLTLLTRISQP